MSANDGLAKWKRSKCISLFFKSWDMKFLMRLTWKELKSSHIVITVIFDRMITEWALIIQARMSFNLPLISQEAWNEGLWSVEAAACSLKLLCWTGRKHKCLSIRHLPICLYRRIVFFFLLLDLWYKQLQHWSHPKSIQTFLFLQKVLYCKYQGAATNTAEDKACLHS